MLKRERYLKLIRPMYDNELIKVITGVRRCGKSVLLQQIINELRARGVEESHLVHLDFEDFANQRYTDIHELYGYLQHRLADDRKYYLFLDEIQEVKGFERIVNSYRATHNVSIFITGSNSHLLSGELATLLTGRYISLQMMPFTFKEAAHIRGRRTPEELRLLFQEYNSWGGMPYLLSAGSDHERKAYIRDLYNSIILKDVVRRGQIKNIDLLEKISQFLITTIGKNVSAKSISDFLKNENIDTTVDTVISYLNYLRQSMLFTKFSRFDIKGKNVLRTLDKYYLADLCFLQLRASVSEFNSAGRLENIVANELLARGFDVYIGKTPKNGEIDFVTVGPAGARCYYQITHSLLDDTVARREFGAFADIKDNFPKYVLSTDVYANYSYDGIRHLNIIDWLMQPEENQAF